MRTLRVVGINEDGSVVLEDSGRRERFTVAADEQLRAAARGDLTRLGQIAIELESQLRPREIQARIRAGASVEQVAAAAGVPPQKIERFAYPVLLERSRTSELAQRAHPVRADGPDSRMLGDVIAHTFGMRGQEYTEAEWDSWKGEDGKWVVGLAWRAGRSDNRAHWTFQPGASGGTVTALDEHASDLVEGLPARPLRTIGEVIDLARTEEAPAEVLAEAPRRAEPHGEVAPARRIEHRRAEPAVEHRRAGPAVEHRRTEPARAEPVAEHRAMPPHREPQQREPVRPAGAAADQQRPEQHRPEQHRPDADEERGSTEPSGPYDRIDQHRPDPQRTETRRPEEPRPSAEEPPAPPADEPPAAPAQEPATAAPRRTKKGKPVMPSWDEVLLGVKGQR
jgi:hypothetical protein